MNKCQECGTEFEGNFCPECGKAWSEEKTCPKCGETIKNDVKFCANCGYAFNNAPTPAPAPKEPEPAPSSRAVPADGWMKSHKNQLIFLSLLLIVVIIVSIAVPLYFANRFNGTYYRYLGETYDKDEYFILESGKYKDEDGIEGKYEIKGEKIIFYVEFFGSQQEFLTGTIKDGVLTLKYMGTERIFAMEGAIKTKDNETEASKNNNKTENSEDGKLNYELNSDKKSYTVLSVGEFKGKNLIIPDSFQGLPITSIAGNAFGGCVGLTSVKIPDSVTWIGNRAFQGCTGLTSIKIPGSVTSIESDAFGGCVGLTSVKIGNGVTSIGDSAFKNCSGLTSIKIPGSVTSIGDGAFYGCTGLTSIDIPDGVTWIGSGTFYHCTSLASIDIPGSVTSIGVDAFMGCTGLTSIYFNGSTEQWKKIRKDRDWRSNSSITQVVCNNGTLEGYEIENS